MSHLFTNNCKKLQTIYGSNCSNMQFPHNVEVPLQDKPAFHVRNIWDKKVETFWLKKLDIFINIINCYALFFLNVGKELSLKTYKYYKYFKHQV